MTSEPQGTYAKIIADSISESGHRVTTMEVRFHRFVLAEFNTHRVFSRNSASSRAIPLRKQVERVAENPALPVVWASEQKGMQGGDEVSEVIQDRARQEWLIAGQSAVNSALVLGAQGIHKSLANRLLEPFMWHTVVVTSTAWDNFFEQRCSPLAQPEIRVAAEMMREAYDASTPEVLTAEEWHLPYISEEDRALIAARVEVEHPGESGSNLARFFWALAVRISAARCARVSYLTQDGKRDLDADLGLYDRLVSADPWHGSPLEHVATPWSSNCERQDLTFRDINGQWQRILRPSPRFGNLLGWRQLRLEVEAEHDHTPGYDRDEDD